METGGWKDLISTLWDDPVAAFFGCALAIAIIIGLAFIAGFTVLIWKFAWYA